MVPADDAKTVIVLPPPLISEICGPNDSNLEIIRRLFQTPVCSRANTLSLSNADEIKHKMFRSFIEKLAEYIQRNIDPKEDLIQALYQATSSEFAENFYDPREAALEFPGILNTIFPNNRAQYNLLQLFQEKNIIFALGPAGTGKTFLAAAYALRQIVRGEHEFIIITRPVVEAGENLGFLPGDYTQKLGPYMLPLFDAIRSIVKKEFFEQLGQKGVLELAPLAYMRGRSLQNAIIILDEAQNATASQIKMLLTRLGKRSKAILTGDPSQSDLNTHTLKTQKRSGLVKSAEILSTVEGVGVQYFSDQDVVRSALVKQIIQAYDNAERVK